MPARVLACLLLTAVPLVAAGVTKLESPPKPEWVTVKADPLITTLTVEKAGKWVLVDDGPTADLRPSGDGKTATFVASTPGRYRLVVVAGDEVHRVAVQVPDPPQPMPPGPGPKPPEPQPPTPTDPLVKKFQEAFDAELVAKEKKADALKDKIELYRQAAELCTTRVAPTPGQKPEDMPYLVLTTGQLLTQVRKAADALHTDTLLLVRKAVRAELQAAMPEDVPLTAEKRKAAADLFTRIKVALEQVK